MDEYVAIASSNLNGAKYNPETKELFIEFKGGARYKYTGVPQEDYDDLLTAASAGSFFNDNIKNSYPYTRV